MFRAFVAVIVFLVVVVASSVQIARADSGAGDPAAPAAVAAPPKGFFEEHVIITEALGLVVFAILLVIVEASDSTTETISTRHYDFFGKPLGISRTQVPVSKVPSSPQEIRRSLMLFAGIYFSLRLTCLAGLFSVIYQCIGSLIDTILKH